MQNLLRPRWMAIKAALFVVIALLAGLCVIRRDPTWTTAGCVVAIAWASSRAYYFAFYVIGHYVDPAFRFAGLIDFARWALRRRRSPPADPSAGR